MATDAHGLKRAGLVLALVVAGCGCAPDAGEGGAGAGAGDAAQPADTGADLGDADALADAADAADTVVDAVDADAGEAGDTAAPTGFEPCLASVPELLAALDADHPRRDSDAAHAVDTLFDVAHRALAAHLAEAVVVSLHGTGHDVADVSDGTRGRGASDNRVAALADALAAELPAIGVRSCDLYDDTGPTWLCGTTNVQGRWLNGAADACTDDAESPSGRFLHLEQPRAMRDQPAAVARALVTMADRRY